MAVIFPFVEESVFRGYGISGLEPRFGAFGALLVTSLLFGPLHWGEGPWAVAQTVVIGALLGGVYLWRRHTLVAATVAHVAFNVIGITGLL